jgi:hypothetical protein
MVKVSLKALIFSPGGIAIVYVLAAFLGAMGFWFIFPSEAAPLPLFSKPWRFIRGAEAFIHLFPALCLSALVLPFGFRHNLDVSFSSFSLRFSEIFRGHIYTAIGLSTVYGLLVLAVLPLMQDMEADKRFKGFLFREAQAKARAYAAGDAWTEAARMVALCEKIWPESPEMERLKQDVYINLEVYNITNSGQDAVEWEERDRVLGQRNPVDAREALDFAETALREGRYYDAHWLASLARRIARPGSMETRTAADMASKAWNAIAALEPNSREVQTYSRYHLKRSGYEALASEDWIRAYYIFKEYTELSPGDPDVSNFIKLAERRIGDIAFFTDEIELAVGEVLTGALFSLPRLTASGVADGRVVARFRSLSTFSDTSYGIDMELMAFDRDGQLLYRLEAPYVKMTPITFYAVPRVALFMRALDRHNRDLRWEPRWDGTERAGLGDTQLILDISYRDFLLLARVRRGEDSLFLGDLFEAEKSLGGLGYIPQVFQALIIRRLAEPALFLPLTILAIVAGWRCRAKKWPRYTGLPLLFLLPLVFNGLVYLYREMINDLSVLMALSFSFSLVIPVFTAGSLILFIGALILLAAQHG